jgi:alkylation response protein AidB-like acyl-CoA dehydrogenase
VDDDLSTDQQVLVDAAARFAEDTFPITKLRERAFDNGSFAATYRRQAGELGWFSLVVPEEQGGGSVSGNGVLDAALVAYTRGRLLQPVGFVGANVVAYAIATAGTDAQRAEALPTLMGGEAPGAWAVGNLSGAPALDGVVDATPNGDGWSLSGAAVMVEDADAGAWLLVSATTPDGPVQLLVAPGTAAVSFAPVDGLDLSRRYADVTFTAASVPASALVGEVGDRALAERLLALASVLTVAECVGAMHQEFEMTVDYAKQRIAFGRPIGSFQAVKHLLADTSLSLEMSKAVVLAAARTLGSDDDYGPQAASIAKALVGEAALELAQNCFQVFGGIGYTWEHDQHLYLRRLTTDAGLFGDADWHREHLCQLAGL